MKKIFFSILTILLSNYMSYSQAIDKNKVDFNNYLIFSEFSPSFYNSLNWTAFNNQSISTCFLAYCDLPTDEYLKIALTEIRYKDVFGEMVPDNDYTCKYTSRFDEVIEISGPRDPDRIYISKLKRGYIYIDRSIDGQDLVAIMHPDRGVVGYYRPNGDFKYNDNAKFDQFGRLLSYDDFLTDIRSISYDSYNNISKVVVDNSNYSIVFDLFWNGGKMTGYSYRRSDENMVEKRTFKISLSNDKGYWTHAYLLDEYGRIIAEFKREIEPYFN